VSLVTISSCFGLKRDAYYKYKCRADKRLKIEQEILSIVRKRRKSLPKEGVRKLMKSLDTEFVKANLKVGRDMLFKILRKHRMLTLRNTVLELQILYTDFINIKIVLKS